MKDKDRYDLEIEIPYSSIEVKQNNDMYLAQEEGFKPICVICKKIITGEPIENVTTNILFDNDKETTYMETNLFCSEVCEYIHLLTSFEHSFYGDTNAIINHLIKAHGCDIQLLEKALNKYLKYLKESTKNSELKE